MSDVSPFDGDTPIITKQVTPTEEDINAAIYVRTSPNSRKKEGYSISSQIKTCWNRCESLGWTVTHIFRDKDESGQDTDRPQFQRMLDEAKARTIDVVVVWKLDRFSRSLMHAVSIESRLRDYDVALHSITEFIDTTTPSGRFSFRSIANAAELERELIKQRTQVGRREAAEAKKWPNGQPPLGYDLDDNNRLIVNDEQAGLVQDIFHRYLNLRSMPQLAYELNRDGYTTKKDNEWIKARIQDILSNEIYVGRYQVAHVDENLPELQIIDDDLFDAVTETRFRFQSDDTNERGEMERSRKERLLDRILNQYETYLDITVQSE